MIRCPTNFIPQIILNGGFPLFRRILDGLFTTSSVGLFNGGYYNSFFSLLYGGTPAPHSIKCLGGGVSQRYSLVSGGNYLSNNSSIFSGGFSDTTPTTYSGGYLEYSYDILEGGTPTTSNSYLIFGGLLEKTHIISGGYLGDNSIVFWGGNPYIAGSSIYSGGTFERSSLRVISGGLPFNVYTISEEIPTIKTSTTVYSGGSPYIANNSVYSGYSGLDMANSLKYSGGTVFYANPVLFITEGFKYSGGNPSSKNTIINFGGYAGDKDTIFSGGDALTNNNSYFFGETNNNPQILTAGFIDSVYSTIFNGGNPLTSLDLTVPVDRGTIYSGGIEDVPQTNIDGGLPNTNGLTVFSGGYSSPTTILSGDNLSAQVTFSGGDAGSFSVTYSGDDIASLVVLSAEEIGTIKLRLDGNNIGGYRIFIGGYPDSSNNTIFDGGVPIVGAIRFTGEDLVTTIVYSGGNSLKTVRTTVFYGGSSNFRNPNVLTGKTFFKGLIIRGGIPSSNNNITYAGGTYIINVPILRNKIKYTGGFVESINTTILFGGDELFANVRLSGGFFDSNTLSILSSGTPTPFTEFLAGIIPVTLRNVYSGGIVYPINTVTGGDLIHVNTHIYSGGTPYVPNNSVYTGIDLKDVLIIHGIRTQGPIIYDGGSPTYDSNVLQLEGGIPGNKTIYTGEVLKTKNYLTGGFPDSFNTTTLTAGFIGVLNLYSGADLRFTDIILSGSDTPSNRYFGGYVASTDTIISGGTSLDAYTIVDGGDAITVLNENRTTLIGGNPSFTNTIYDGGGILFNYVRLVSGSPTTINTTIFSGEFPDTLYSKVYSGGNIKSVNRITFSGSEPLILMYIYSGGNPSYTSGIVYSGGISNSPVISRYVGGYVQTSGPNLYSGGIPSKYGVDAYNGGMPTTQNTIIYTGGSA